MNLDNLKNKQRHIPKTLLCLSGLLALLIAAKVSAFVIKSNQIPEDIVRALNASGRSEEEIKKYQSIYTGATAALKKKNMFMPPVPPKKNPVTRVTAIFGDEACISNKWYKVGDKIRDAEITKISPNEVTIVWNDKESKLNPFDTVILAAAPKPSSNNNTGRKDKKEKKQPRPEQMENRQPTEGTGISGNSKRMQEYMNRLSPEERKRMRERMRSRDSRSGGRPRGGRPRGGSSRGGRPRR
ncbi:MAG: hypothetical protein FVQ82_11585 [Planctomycetes bacterium]|nr:hypothetical protein [Planctomycetota bacterium]